MEEKVGFKLNVPHVFIILAILVFLAAAATWVLPAGTFDRVENEEGREVVVPGTYKVAESSPVGLFIFLMSFYDGIIEAADVISFILLVSGAFAIVRKTGALDAGITSAVQHIRGGEYFALTILMVLFAICGATFGMYEEAYPFVFMLMPLCVQMGFDAMTGAAVLFIGINAGFAGAFFNPFTVGLSQSLAKLPLYSGIGFRVITCIILVGEGIWFTLRYAKKIRENPDLSISKEATEYWKNRLNSSSPESKMNLRHTVVLLILLAAMIGLIYGVLKYEWYMAEISALFLLMGIVSGFVGGISLNKMAEEMEKAASEIIGPCMVIGFARAIMVVLNKGNVTDTILYGMSNTVSIFGGIGAAVLMYIIIYLLEFLISSGTAKAAILVPILTPLCDLVGVSRQTMVLAYQLGDGILNMWEPTSPEVYSILGAAKIKFVEWFKWALPITIIWTVTGFILVVVAQLINYGP
ncbi:MAG: hypothetical protein PWR06_2072 [Thermoanaerobacteraceae bacterium]|nr:hypothetical protein [Thermoanaerobacteraceae bacterium]